MGAVKFYLYAKMEASPAGQVNCSPHQYGQAADDKQHELDMRCHGIVTMRPQNGAFAGALAHCFLQVSAPKAHASALPLSF